VPIEDAAAGTFRLEGERIGPPARPEWAGADDVAMILHTSGSTSLGKAVPLRHRHKLAFARAIKAAYGIGPGDRYLHVMPMFHGHGISSGLTGTLASGCGAICPPKVDVASIFAHIEALRPTCLSGAYTILQSIHDQLNVDGHREIAQRARLRFIGSGSGRLDPRIARGLEDAFGAPVLV